ncbi:MAG: hypothetical protein ACTHMC_22055 [Pseudobacter sp.]|uniref:hypothetical protein n=1 Tax=Pseudobacter sp. TaxID=2045420 RepID=UPI003F80764F
MKWKILLLIVSISSMAACKKNNDSGLTGKYVEVTPVEGRSYLKFLPGGLMVRGENNTDYRDTFSVKFSLNTITLTHKSNYGGAIKHEFRKIDDRSFEIENMLPQIPEAPKSFMLFRK